MRKKRKFYRYYILTEIWGNGVVKGKTGHYIVFDRKIISFSGIKEMHNVVAREIQEENNINLNGLQVVVVDFKLLN